MLPGLAAVNHARDPVRMTHGPTGHGNRSGDQQEHSSQRPRKEPAEISHSSILARPGASAHRPLVLPLLRRTTYVMASSRRSAGGEFTPSLSESYRRMAPGGRSRSSARTQKFQGAGRAESPASEHVPDRVRESPLARLSSHCPVTQTHCSTATRKSCKCRPFQERLKGFEPSTSAWQAVDGSSLAPQNACKRTTSDRLDRGLAFRELCGDTGGSDKERTMSDP